MAKRNFRMPCVVCGVLTSGGNRCATHQAIADARARERLNQVHNQSTKRDKYTSDYRRQAKLIKQQALEANLDCYLCGSPLAIGEAIHIDHVYPEQGADSPLAPVHASCNLRKGNRPPNGS